MQLYCSQRVLYTIATHRLRIINFARSTTSGRARKLRQWRAGVSAFGAEVANQTADRGNVMAFADVTIVPCPFRLPPPSLP